MVWLLIWRLSLGLPTALQIRGNRALLFHEGGVSLFQDLTDNTTYLGLEFSDPSSKIWVLVDSNSTLPEPTPVFRMGHPFFVIETTSHVQRLEWCKKVHSKYFCMKTWALSEVLQVYVIPLSGVHNTQCFCSRPFLGVSSGGPYDESKLRYLYNEYRASPRELVMYASKPEEFKALVLEQVERIGPDRLRHVLRTPESDDSSHLFTRIEPSTMRYRTEKTIASPGAFKLIWNQHLKNRVTDTEYYYDIFQQGGPVTATAAGWIFEFRMHQLLSQGYSINLFPYSDYCNSHNKRKEKTFRLVASPEYPLDRGIKLVVGRYYRPDAKNFATIDALLLIKPPKDPDHILLMFQIIRNRSKHDVKVAGLDMIEELKLPPNTHKYYVAVTADGIEPSIQVPEGRFKDVQAYHHPVPQSTLFPHTN